VTLPKEARDGFMRAWLAIPKERRPQYDWVEQAVSRRSDPTASPPEGKALAERSNRAASRGQAF
jgi:hypothetical protein